MQEIAKNDARERSCASWAELERSGHVERVTVVLKRNGKGSYGIDLNDYNVVTASTHTRPMTLTTIKTLATTIQLMTLLWQEKRKRQRSQHLPQPHPRGLDAESFSRSTQHSRRVN